MVLSETDLINIGSAMRDDLATRGFGVEQTSDFQFVEQLAHRLDKTYFTGALNPRQNDFFEGNSFFLVLTMNGEPVGMMGYRIDMLGRETLGSAYVRKIRNLYPEEDALAVPADWTPPAAHRVSGSVVFLGDLFVTERARSKSDKRYLESFFTYGYCVSILKWPELDWIYCFLRDQDVRSGRTAYYGFTEAHPFANSVTTRFSSAEVGKHWLCLLSRDALEGRFAGLKNQLDRSRVVNNSSASVRQRDWRKDAVVLGVESNAGRE